MSATERPDATAAGATAAGEAQRSVIHDLGYRGYDGARSSRGGVLGYLVRQGYASCFGVGRTWKGKVMPWVCVGLLSAPMLIAAAIMILIPFEGAEPVFHPARVPYAFYTLVVLFAAVAAPVVFSADLRSRAIVHYLSRPLSRRDYVLARLAALVLALFTLQAIGILIGTLGWWLAGGSPGTVWGAAAVGALGALGVSTCVGVISGLIAALTPKRGVATAVVLGVLLVLSSVVVAVTESLRATGNQLGMLARWTPALSPSTAVERVVKWATGNHELTAALDDATAAGFLLLIVVGCALGLVALMRRYRRVN
ncbi:ABC transporter permease subunit [Kytococcus sedentarius]|uniref:ABC transporter permease subunit n=1 Tax=Kytococcus sedentarius TaxID=1276 RepID=UPI0035BC1E86